MTFDIDFKAYNIQWCHLGRFYEHQKDMGLLFDPKKLSRILI